MYHIKLLLLLLLFKKPSRSLENFKDFLFFKKFWAEKWTITVMG